MNVQFIDKNYGKTLDQLKADKILELNKNFMIALSSGFPSSVDGTTRNYPLDPTSMLRWTGAMSVIDTNTVTNPLIIKDINGNQITVSPDQFKQLATDGYNFFMQQEQRLWSLEADVMACTDEPSVQDIAWE